MSSMPHQTTNLRVGRSNRSERANKINDLARLLFRNIRVRNHCGTNAPETGQLKRPLSPTRRASLP